MIRPGPVLVAVAVVVAAVGLALVVGPVDVPVGSVGPVGDRSTAASGPAEAESNASAPEDAGPDDASSGDADHTQAGPANGTTNRTSHPNVTVRPGSYLATGCTLGFVVESTTNGTRYGVTAGHCYEDRNLGTVIDLTTENGKNVPIGELAVFRVTSGAPFNELFQRPPEDWALIRLWTNASWVNVSASVMHWTGPTGLADGDEVDRGDALCWYGQGFQGHVDQPPPVTYPPQRCGDLHRFHRYERDGKRMDWFHVWGPPDGGDSGSLVIHHPTGQTIGLLTRFVVGPRVDIMGPTVCGILNAAELAGWGDLSLVTAPYDPPPAREDGLGKLPDRPVPMVTDAGCGER